MSLKSQMITMSMLGILLLPSTAKSDCNQEIKDCETVIDLADKAIAEKNAMIEAQDKAISDLKVTTEDLSNQLTDANRAKDRWFRNPLYDIPIGAFLALGVAVNPLLLIGAPVFIIIGLFN